MYRVVIVFLLVSVMLVGCGTVRSFEATVDKVKGDSMTVNCSDAVNKGKHGAIIDVGYICTITLTDKTRIVNDSDEKVLSVHDLTGSPKVKITLEKAESMNKILDSRLIHKAKEIRLLTS